MDVKTKMCLTVVRLCIGLPAQQCQQWHLLFNSNIHGMSFNTFFGKIRGRGATLLIVKDTEGSVCGGFAPQPWDKKGSFYGDYSSFLFTLEPQYTVYKPSGVNENFQWCGQGFSELPNGVGFGGQVSSLQCSFCVMWTCCTSGKGMLEADN